jgi:hypothetical protein
VAVAPALAVTSTLLLGFGAWLILKNHRKLSRRAKELGMWPTREDTPAQPWTIYPEWSAALYFDLFRRSAQRDLEYRRYQDRMRLGLLLSFVGFAGAVILVKIVDA